VQHEPAEVSQGPPKLGEHRNPWGVLFVLGAVAVIAWLGYLACDVVGMMLGLLFAGLWLYFTRFR
jgi:uncharacterized membrane protein (DUF4010 family)